jgi:hypothetical protein
VFFPHDYRQQDHTKVATIRRGSFVACWPLPTHRRTRRADMCIRTLNESNRNNFRQVSAIPVTATVNSAIVLERHRNAALIIHDQIWILPVAPGLDCGL